MLVTLGDGIRKWTLGTIEVKDDIDEDTAFDAIVIFQQLIVEAVNMLKDGGVIKYYMLPQLINMAIEEAKNKQESRG